MSYDSLNGHRQPVKRPQQFASCDRVVSLLGGYQRLIEGADHDRVELGVVLLNPYQFTGAGQNPRESLS